MYTKRRNVLEFMDNVARNLFQTFRLVCFSSLHVVSKFSDW